MFAASKGPRSPATSWAAAMSSPSAGFVRCSCSTSASAAFWRPRASAAPGGRHVSSSQLSVAETPPSASRVRRRSFSASYAAWVFGAAAAVAAPAVARLTARPAMALVVLVGCRVCPRRRGPRPPPAADASAEDSAGGSSKPYTLPKRFFLCSAWAEMGFRRNAGLHGGATGHQCR